MRGVIRSAGDRVHARIVDRGQQVLMPGIEHGRGDIEPFVTDAQPQLEIVQSRCRSRQNMSARVTPAAWKRGPVLVVKVDVDRHVVASHVKSPGQRVQRTYPCRAHLCVFGQFFALLDQRFQRSEQTFP